MQYYKNPQDSDSNELIKCIDTFCGIIDQVNEFRVIGGEPFMNKDFHLVIKRLIEETKVRKIIIYTNGTIVPGEDKIRYLRDKKVLIFITDYGILSKKIVALTQILRREGIGFYIYKAQGWTDCAKIVKHNRSIEGQKEIFRNCCAKNTITLSKDRLYRCPFSANAARLTAVPDYEDDYVDILLFAQKKAGIKKIRNKIKTLLLDKKLLETCDYCSGRSFGDAEIQFAVQAERALEYETRK